MTNTKADLPVYDTITILRDCLSDLCFKLDDNIVPAIDVLTQVNLREELRNTYIEINSCFSKLSEEQKHAVLKMLQSNVYNSLAEMETLIDKFASVLNEFKIPEIPNAEEKQVGQKSGTRKKRSKKGSKKSGSQNKEPSSAS